MLCDLPTPSLMEEFELEEKLKLAENELQQASLEFLEENNKKFRGEEETKKRDQLIEEAIKIPTPPKPQFKHTVLMKVIQ